MKSDNGPQLDPESEAFLKTLAQSQERVRSNRVPGVKSVLIVLSAKAMIFDVEALRQKVLLSYPEAAVYILTTLGKPIGNPPPAHVDLLIDFTGPGQRQGLFFAKKLRRMARVAVGRRAGLFRAKIYDRLFDEREMKKRSLDLLAHERQVQREVLALAGVALAQQGEILPDIGKSIALKLPPLSRI